MLLQLCTWSEVQSYLERSRGIVVPVGSTEQHGPNGLIGTDAICAEAVARGIGEAAEALVAPTLAIGMAQHHMAFPGTMTLRPATLIMVVRDCVESLASHGFERFFFVNGHGGNVATLGAAFQEIYAAVSLAPAGRGPAVRCMLRNWWMGEAVTALSGRLFGDKEGRHATPSEVALAQHVHPEAIKPAGDIGAPATPAGDYSDAADFRRRFTDGRIGSWPQLATPEAGRELYETAVEELARDYRAFVTGD